MVLHKKKNSIIIFKYWKKSSSSFSSIKKLGRASVTNWSERENNFQLRKTDKTRKREHFRSRRLETYAMLNNY